ADRDAGHDRHDRRNHRDTGRRTILRGCAFRHVHVDVLLVEDRRLDAEVHRTRPHIGCSRRDRLLHHVTEVTRDRHLALTGHHDAFDRQQLAADFGPGQAGDNTNLILALSLAEAIALDAKVLVQIGLGYLDAVDTGLHDLRHGLRSE